MASQSSKVAVDRVKNRIETNREKLEPIRSRADAAELELASAAEEFQDALESALELTDRLAKDVDWWPTAKRFIRRMLSREFIIAVVAILAIWNGNLESNEAIGVAIAGGGIALGRGVAKASSGGTDG